MKYQIIIDTENDEFTDRPAYEIQRILGRLSAWLLAEDKTREQLIGEQIALHDFNGNRVGTAELIK